MIDREKVIKALERCAVGKSCDGCPMHKECTGTTNAAMAAAVELLKEQQKLIDDITQRRANNGAFD